MNCSFGALVFIAFIGFGCRDSGTNPPLEDKSAIKVLSPGKGGAFKVGQIIDIKWRINPDSIKGSQIINFTPDNGLTIINISGKSPIETGHPDYFTGNEARFRWTIPDSVYKDEFLNERWIATVSAACRIQVDAPYEAYAKSGFSNGTFTITK